MFKRSELTNFLLFQVCKFLNKRGVCDQAISKLREEKVIVIVFLQIVIYAYVVQELIQTGSQLMHLSMSTGVECTI